jgi:hypothetical protein
LEKIRKEIEDTPSTPEAKEMVSAVEPSLTLAHTALDRCVVQLRQLWGKYWIKEHMASVDILFPNGAKLKVLCLRPSFAPSPAHAMLQHFHLFGCVAAAAVGKILDRRAAGVRRADACR